LYIHLNCIIELAHINEVVALFLPVFCRLRLFERLRTPILRDSRIILKEPNDVRRVIDTNGVLAVGPHFEIWLLENEDPILFQNALSRANVFRLLEIQCKWICCTLLILYDILFLILANFKR